MPSKLGLKSQPNVKLRMAAGYMDAIQALVEILTNVKACKLLGSLMPSKLWSKSQPNVKLRRLLRVYGCHPSSGGNPHKRQSLQAAWAV